MFDNTAMTLAVPAIAASLHGAVADVQWMLSAPPLAAAVLLPLAGALGDRYGSLGTMRVGLVVFALGALAMAASPTMAALLAARAVLGCGQALMLPNGVSVLAANVPATSRSHAVGSWMTISSLGLILGPLGGGLAVEHLGWRYLLAGHVLISLLGLVGTATLRDSEHRSPRPLDLTGLLLAGVTLFFTCFGLIEVGRGSGRTPLALCSLGLSAVAAVVFIAVERRQPHPFVDVNMVRDKRFATLLCAVLLYNAAIAGTTFLLALMLQNARGVAPSTAGLMLLGATVGMPLGGQLSGRLGPRMGQRAMMTVAAIALGLCYACAAGLALAPLALLLIPLLGAGVACGTLFAADTVAALSIVAPEKVSSGLASVSLSRQVGALVGIAGLGTLSETVSATTHPLGARTSMVVASVTLGLCSVLLWRFLRLLRTA